MVRHRILSDWLSISPGLQEPLYRQIARQIAAAVSECRLSSGSYLPASRTLAAELGVSRNTVLNAYDQLIADGLLETIGGSGTRVRGLSPRTHDKVDDAASWEPQEKVSIVQSAPAMHPRGAPTAFHPGIPALDMFPRQTWSRMLRRHGLHGGREMLDNEHHGGYRPLQQRIAGYLLSSRGVHCEPPEVIVVGSTRAAINFASALMTEPEDKAVICDPGYYRACTSFELSGLRPVPVPVDADGLCVDKLLEVPDARVVYVTPCHHWPTGVSLSMERRHLLLEWAERQRAWIFEDDYDSEFHFEGPLPLPLKAKTESRQVIFLGTFSRTLAPSIRCAYLVVPRPLARRFTDYAVRLGVEPPLQIQAALADFMEEGHFTRHIQRMRKVYRARRDALSSALNEILGDVVSIRRSAGGLQLIVDLPPQVPAEAVAQHSVTRNLLVRPLSRYCVDAAAPNALHLGFASVPVPQIASAVRLLSEVIRLVR